MSSRYLACIWLAVGSVSTVLAQAPLADASLQAERLAAWIDAYGAVPLLDTAALGEPYRPRIFAQVQLRTEADRLRPERQRYSIRAEPLLPYRRRAERRLQAAQRAALPTGDEPARRDAAREALALLFDLVTVARADEALAENVRLNDSLAAITRLRLAEPRFDVERLLDVEDDLSELSAARATGQALLTREPLPLPAGTIVSPATALSRAADLLALGVRPDGVLAAELALIDANVAMERADNWKIVDFVQVDYRSDLEQAERFSLGFGIALPHARVPQLDELKLERVEETQEARLEDRERTRELARAYADMLAAADELYALQAAAADRRRRRDRLSAALRTSAETRPDDLLRIRRRNLRDRLELIEAEAEVLEAYAEMVGRSGWTDAEGLETWILER